MEYAFLEVSPGFCIHFSLAIVALTAATSFGGYGFCGRYEHQQPLRDPEKLLPEGTFHALNHEAIGYLLRFEDSLKAAELAINWTRLQARDIQT